MTRSEVIATLRQHEPALRAAGVVSLSLFGYVAREEAEAAGVDIAVRLAERFSSSGFDYYYQLQQCLSRLIGCKVDVVPELVRKERFNKRSTETELLPF